MVDAPREEPAVGERHMDLNIRYHLDGRIEVTGPLDNEIICFGLLEKAKLEIMKHMEQRRAKR